MSSTPQLRHYGHQQNVVNHQPALSPFSFPLSSFQSLAQSTLTRFRLFFSRRIFHLPPRRRLSCPLSPPLVSAPYQSTWHLRVTSGLWRHLAARRPLRLRHFIDCDHKSFYTRTSCMPPLEIAVSIGRGWFYVPHCFIVFTTRGHIDLILIPRYYT